MATVLEECSTEDKRSVAPFCEKNDSLQIIFLKKCFPFYVRSVCRIKRFTAGSRNSLKDVRKSQMMPDQVGKWLRQQSNNFCACTFRRTGKAMGQVYQCRWRICREINALNMFEYHNYIHFLDFKSIYIFFSTFQLILLA
jgi:hypothetical protein